jgi:hypothetical protein
MLYFKSREAVRRRRAKKAAPDLAYSKMFQPKPLNVRLDRWLRRRRDLDYLRFAAKKREPYDWRSAFGTVDDRWRDGRP